MLRLCTNAAIATATLFLSSCGLYPISPTVRLDQPTVSSVEVIRYNGDADTSDSCRKMSDQRFRECEVAHALEYAQKANQEYLAAQAQYEGLPAAIGGLRFPSLPPHLHLEYRARAVPRLLDSASVPQPRSASARFFKIKIVSRCIPRVRKVFSV